MGRVDMLIVDMLHKTMDTVHGDTANDEAITKISFPNFYERMDVARLVHNLYKTGGKITGIDSQKISNFLPPVAAIYRY